MKVRNILVAASAAALLVGSSYGALAGSWSSSKSGTVQVSHADPHGSTTFLITGGQADAGGKQAAASYGSWGAGAAAQKTEFSHSSSSTGYYPTASNGYKTYSGSSTTTASNSSLAISAGGSSGCASVGSGSPC